MGLRFLCKLAPCPETKLYQGDTRIFHWRRWVSHAKGTERNWSKDDSGSRIQSSLNRTNLEAQRKVVNSISITRNKCVILLYYTSNLNICWIASWFQMEDFWLQSTFLYTIFGEIIKKRKSFLQSQISERLSKRKFRINKVWEESRWKKKDKNHDI